MAKVITPKNADKANKEPPANFGAHACSKTGLGLQKQARLKEAIIYFLRAVELSPDDEKTNHLMRLAAAYIRNDEAENAADIYRGIIKSEPQNSAPYVFLSAIHHTLGDKKLARNLLVEGVTIQPVVNPDPIPSKLPNVLKLSGIENAYFYMGRSSNGQRSLVFRGGRFSSTNLVDKSRFNEIDFLVLNNNLTESKKVPHFDLVLNTIADPDVEGNSLSAVSNFLKQNKNVPVINVPEDVLLTTRDENYRRLNKIKGVKFPLTLRLRVDEDFFLNPPKIANDLGFKYPILVRNTGTQTGRTFVKTETADAFSKTIRQRKGQEVYLIQYVETFIRNKYFHKMRAFFIGGKIYPVVCHIDTVWNVHGTNRGTVMVPNPWMTENEKSYMADPHSHLGNNAYKILEKLYETIRLDFFGVDFAITPDGTFLIYELNPAMRHNYSHTKLFPYLRPYYEKISHAFSDMVEKRIKI